VENHNGLMVILSDLDMVLPEKIGGWSQFPTGSSRTLPGAARVQHSFVSLAGEKIHSHWNFTRFIFILQ
jgi:hypothetical protein